ncbi:MAG: glycoside hydrolase family 18 protein [Deltaproteobacteria bacterium]|nr:glycoside hydrolase family 18 protein [Deltaproteobacteria bacterium]
MSGLSFGRGAAVLGATLASLLVLACDEASPDVATSASSVTTSTATTVASGGGEGGAGGAPSTSSGLGGSGDGPPKPRPIWVTGYYAGWMEGHLPVDEIDFTAISHLAHFSWVPMPNGTLDKTSLGWTASQATKVVAAAHAAGKKALLVVGGAWTQEGFRAHLAPAKRAAFVKALVDGVAAHGYDGIDVDMEPVSTEDAPAFGAFATELRAALDGLGNGRLLTAAVDWNKTAFVPVQDVFDQVNLMTYDMAGTWEGWETWHNSPLHNGGANFASTGQPMPSVETRVAKALADGAKPAKLGIGGAFYGYVWQGANGPNQSIAGLKVTANKAYHAIMAEDFSASAFLWHDGVEAPYLSLGAKGSPDSRFISYDDAKSLTKKIAWLRETGLGGLIVWELGGGYRPTLPPGERHPLLAAVKDAAFP